MRRSRCCTHHVHCRICNLLRLLTCNKSSFQLKKDSLHFIHCHISRDIFGFGAFNILIPPLHDIKSTLCDICQTVCGLQNKIVRALDMFFSPKLVICSSTTYNIFSILASIAGAGCWMWLCNVRSQSVTICDNQGSDRARGGSCWDCKACKAASADCWWEPAAGCWLPASCPALCSDVRGEVYS